MPVKTFGIQKEDLRRMRFDEGMKIRQIAAHYGCAVRLINTYMKRYGLLKQPARYDHLDVNELVHLYEVEDKTLKELAEIKGVSIGAIRTRIEGVARSRRRGRRDGMYVGENNPVWQGGRRENNGYVRVLVEPGREVPEHRLVMEEVLGRPLHDDEHVHHMDFDGLNNDPPNLMAMWPIEHRRLHSALRRAPSLDQRQWLEDYRALEDKNEWRALAA